MVSGRLNAGNNLKPTNHTGEELTIDWPERIPCRHLFCQAPSSCHIDHGSPCPLLALNTFEQMLLHSDVLAGVKRSTWIKRTLEHDNDFGIVIVIVTG